MYKSAILAVALFIAFPPDDISASLTDRLVEQHTCDLWNFCSNLDQLKSRVDNIAAKPDDFGADSRTEKLLAEQQQKILSLLQDVDSLKEMVSRLTAIAVPTPTPPPPVGVAIPGAPSRFRLVKEPKTWDEAEAACRNSSSHLATFADLDEYRSLISPLFKMCTEEYGAVYSGCEGFWVGARGLGPEIDEEEFENYTYWAEGQDQPHLDDVPWIGDGFKQVDGTPFPFNTVQNSGSIPWGKVPRFAMASAAKSPSSDYANSCLAAINERDGEVDHSLLDVNIFTNWPGCQDDASSICET